MRASDPGNVGDAGDPDAAGVRLVRLSVEIAEGQRVIVVKMMIDFERSERLDKADWERAGFDRRDMASGDGALGENRVDGGDVGISDGGDAGLIPAAIFHGSEEERFVVNDRPAQRGARVLP